MFISVYHADFQTFICNYSIITLVTFVICESFGAGSNKNLAVNLCVLEILTRIFYSLTYVQVLEALLPKGMIIPSAFETVGHIAHLNLRDEHQPLKYLIAKVPSCSCIVLSIFNKYCSFNKLN